MAAEEEFSAITDKIPQRPVTATEAGGYSLVIIAALGVSWLEGARLRLVVCLLQCPSVCSSLRRLPFCPAAPSAFSVCGRGGVRGTERAAVPAQGVPG